MANPDHRTIHWFRRDLRLQHNPALAWIGAQGGALLPVYIHAPDEEAPWRPGGASRWWLHHSLTALGRHLEQQGMHLQLELGDSAESLLRLCRHSGARRVTWNRRCEPHLAERDHRVQRALEAQGIEVHTFDDGMIRPPGRLLNRQGQPYRVFTPFWRELRRWIGANAAAFELCPQKSPSPWEKGIGEGIQTSSIEELNLLDRHPWHEKLHHQWQPGEAAAQRRLDHFMSKILADYHETRDRPAVDGTSRLSPHLHFGEIALQQIVASLLPLLDGEAGPRVAQGAERFLSELAWREFARHILHHFPHTSHQPMDARFSDTMWQEDPDSLQAWQRGRTGIALVDAGMQELWKTGWMHNRVRMVVGSLLTKNLGIPWQAGARWFWDTLVDADLANNSLGWQWIAGCGVDAAPYFRIFNPDTQAQRFDPKGKYQARWLPLDWQPDSIIDLKESRRLALERYQAHIKATMN